MSVTFILGGARSGKSRYAQALAEANGGELVYIATAEPIDAEMTERIARHRGDRGPRWRTVEVPVDLATAVEREAANNRVLLIDCLTLWLGNLMHFERDIDSATEALRHTVEGAPGDLVLVANEVGLGLVPGTPLGRNFRDQAGRLNQCMAVVADEVVLLVAGIPMVIKARIKR